MYIAQRKGKRRTPPPHATLTYIAASDRSALRCEHPDQRCRIHQGSLPASSRSRGLLPEWASCRGRPCLPPRGKWERGTGKSEHGPKYRGVRPVRRVRDAPGESRRPRTLVFSDGGLTLRGHRQALIWDDVPHFRHNVTACSRWSLSTDESGEIRGRNPAQALGPCERR